MITKFWIKPKGPKTVPPYSHTTEWLHIDGIAVTFQHHKLDDRYKDVKVYWEEMGQEVHIGWATNLYAIHRYKNLKIRYPLFNLMIWKPALKYPNVTHRLLMGSFLHRKFDPIRLVINLDKNPHYGTIGYQCIHRR